MTLSLSRRKPFGGLSLFDDAFSLSDFFNAGPDRCLAPVSVVESEKTIVVSAEVPGVDKKDIKIDYKDHVLTISGEKNIEKQEKGYSEIQYGKFSRSIQLHSDVDFDKASAKQNNGVLTITLPKSKVIEAKSIKID